MADLPLFNIGAAARLDITTPGSPSYVAYYALVAQYHFGVPIIHARAPAELATAIGQPLIVGMNDPGVAASVSSVIVVTFPDSVPTVHGTGFSRPVSTADPSGILVGVNYTDSHGVFWPDVAWEWVISVEGYAVVTPGIPATAPGRWDQQVVTWNGDGIAGRLIPTTFDLTQGRVAIWVFNKGPQRPSFRHSQMAGTIIPNGNFMDTVGGIMAFQSGGFTVKDNNPTNVNTIGTSYTAVVLRDTSSSGRSMQIGSYFGWPLMGGTHRRITDTDLQGAVSVYDGPHGSDLGLFVSYTNNAHPAKTGAGTVASVINSGEYLIAGGVADDPGFPFWTAFAPVQNNRPISTGLIAPATMFWVFGKGQQMLVVTADMPAGGSVTLKVEAQTAIGKVNALGTTISLSDQSDLTNGGDWQYFWVAFNVPPGNSVYSLFRAWTRTGPGTVPLGFTPAFAIGRNYTDSVPSPFWKGPLQTGQDSTRMDGTDFPTGGLESFTGGGLTVGATLGSGTAYGFALLGSGGVDTSTPAVPPVYNPPGPTGPPGTPPPTIPPTPPPGGGGSACAAQLPIDPV